MSREHKRAKRKWSSRRVALTCLASLLALGAILALADAADLPGRIPRRAYTASQENPFDIAPLYVAQDSKAAKAYRASDGWEKQQLEVLATTPTAVWLTPDHRPVGKVGAYVTKTLEQARDEGSLVTFVVYGIPGRDAGGASGLSIRADEYLAWIDEIARAIRRNGTLCAIIMEPDALALSTGNRELENNLPLLSNAVGELSSTGAAVYIDAGHSDWVDAERMATLLRHVGIDRVRGFSLNVSSYYPDSDARAYGEKLAQLTGAHYVIDTSRNGAGFGYESVGTWENPRGTRIGRAPRAVQGDSLDAYLWIKAPGESDGAANGGPAAGEWWQEKALDLVS